MSVWQKKDYIVNKPPLENGENRDEYFLIDVLGNWIPENEIIFYGLLNTEYSDAFIKLRDVTSIDPHELYRDTCYFNGRDMVRYLASPDKESIDDSLTDEEVDVFVNLAYQNYKYTPCSELMIKHAVLAAGLNDFVKHITLVFPWEIRDIDAVFLARTIPNSIMSKIELVSGTIMQAIEHRGVRKYTSIISNSFDDINYMIDHHKECGTDETFFLLRNHSGNTKIIFDENGNPEFDEVNTRIIIEKIIDPATGYPICPIRFARYEPTLYQDRKPNMKSEGLYGQL